MARRGSNAAAAPGSARVRDSKPAAREHWQRVWAENYRDLTERLLEATSAEHTQWGICPKCKTKMPIAHPDTRARTDAISKLHELAGFRLKPDDSTAATAPTLIRRIVLPGGREIEGGEPGSAPSDHDD